MKNNIPLFCFAILLNLDLSAQSLVPEKSTIMHNDKTRPCLMLKLDPEPKMLKNAWINFLEKEYDFKLKGMGWFSNKDLLHAEEVTILKLSSRKMDFYTHVVEDENGSEMKVFASLGYDIYLNEENYPVEFKALNEMMLSFLKQYLPEYYNHKIEETSERVVSLTKEIKSLNEDIKDNNDHIDKLAKEIDEYKVNLKEKSQKLKDAEIKLKGRQDKLERIRIKLQKL